MHPQYERFNSVTHLSGVGSTDTAGGEVEGRESLSALEAGFVTDTGEKLKNVGKNWVLLQIHSLREAVPSLVLTDKASKRQVGMIFTQ